MSDRILFKLGIGLAFAAALVLFRVAVGLYRSPRFSFKAKLLTTAGIFVALYVALAVYPEEAAFYKAKREAASDPIALTFFQDKYPTSRRIGEVDDMLWQATSGPKGDWALYLYKEHFRFGKHKEELKQRLLKKKQDELTEIRTHADIKKTLNFMAAYGGAEAVEAREILLSTLELTQAGNKQSPPPALLHQLIRSSPETITYWVGMTEGTDCPNSESIRGVIIDRLTAAIGAFHVRPQATPNEGSIRARAVCVVEKGASYGDLAHSELVVVQFELRLPGQSQPAWTGTVTARTPEKVSGLSKGSGRNQEVITDKTAEALKEELKPAFLYW